MTTKSDGASLDSYRAAFEQAPDAMLIHDASGTIIDANEAATELFGWGREQLCGETLANLHLEIGGALRDAVEDGSTQTAVTLDDGGTTLRLTATVERVGGDQFLARVFDNRDETTDSSVLQEERQLEAIVENLPVVLFALGPKGTFTMSRGKGLEALGLEPGELNGVSVFDAYADYPDIVEAVEQALDGEAVRVEQEVGDLVFETQYRPVTDENGAVQQVIGVSLDITERNARKKQLERNDAILEQLTETTDDVLWLFNSDFTEIQFVNESYEDVWGRDIADLQDDAMDFMEGVHPDDRHIVFDAVERLQNGESTDAEYRVNPGEDYERWVRVKGEPVYRDGEIVRAAGFARDITDHKKRERELEKSNERLERFAYVASHDLQEPLRTISNYTEMLAEDYADALDEEAQRIVDVIVTGSDRMQSMIDGLLDYSRVTTRGSEFAPVDVNEVVDDVATDLAAILEEEDGSLEWGTLPTVEADHNQLRQVVQNLAKNAVEHADEPVEVDVRGTDVDDHYRFEVEDDGPGIAESRQEKIFRIFKSSHQYQTSSQAKGIGLAICDQIIDRHGGDIWVESEPGEGATFVFTIDKEKGSNDRGET